MSNEKSDNGIALAIAVFAAVIAILVWRASMALGLEPATGFSVLFRFVGVALITIAFGFSEYWFEPFRLGNTWWVVALLVWWATWPAIDDWGGKQPVNDGFAFAMDTPWWADDWVKWTVAGVILSIGLFGIWRKISR